MNYTVFMVIFLLLTQGCTQQKGQEIKIATNSWIGYAPLFYAKEKGYLKELNMKLITSVSLAEASNIYEMGQADIVTTTQHEYFALKTITHDIEPIVLLDRSYGGDMVLSNKSLKALKEAKKIYAYLEIDSINLEIVKDFIAFTNLDKSKIIFTNKDQDKIQSLSNDTSKTMLIITYAPYNIKLETKGFKEVASTKDEGSIVVIDALCAKKSLIKNQSKRLKALKKILDKSIKAIQSNPKETYLLVESYLQNISYAEYLDALEKIRWINKPEKNLLDVMKKLNYSTKDIIR